MGRFYIWCRSLHTHSYTIDYGTLSQSRTTFILADVKVHTSISTISTNALHIDNGALTLGPLNITSNGGSNFAIYDEDTFDELGNTMNRIKNDTTQVGQNMKRVTDNTKSIHQVELRPPSDTKDVLNDAKESINGISDSLKVIKIR